MLVCPVNSFNHLLPLCRCSFRLLHQTSLPGVVVDNIKRKSGAVRGARLQGLHHDPIEGDLDRSAKQLDLVREEDCGLEADPTSYPTQVPGSSQRSALNSLNESSTNLQIQTFAWNITRSPYFNQLILSTIICNMVAMASDHYNPSEGWSLVSPYLILVLVLVLVLILVLVRLLLLTTISPSDPGRWQALGYLNWLFFGVYWFEICVKLLAFRSRFWASRWNIFDFLVVTGSTIEQ
eukprot:450098-Hanusia_phi.AAC.1